MILGLCIYVLLCRPFGVDITLEQNSFNKKCLQKNKGKIVNFFLKSGNLDSDFSVFSLYEFRTFSDFFSLYEFWIFRIFFVNIMYYRSTEVKYYVNNMHESEF